MKKIIFLSLMVLFTAKSLSQGVDLGIKVGANFATLTELPNVDTITGLNFGAFFTIKFNDKIAIQGDVLYSQQGAEFDLDKVDLDYVNVPIVFKYYLVKKLNLHIGPQFGFLVSDFDASEFEDSYESTDVSGVVGLGLDLPLGFRVDGRYNFGLTEFLPDVKNNVFSLSVGWTLL
jgi:hypothetical protein